METTPYFLVFLLKNSVSFFGILYNSRNLIILLLAKIMYLIIKLDFNSKNWILIFDTFF